MDINQSFPSKYLKSSDLQGRRATVQMNYVQVEKVGQNDEKPVLYFIGKAKGMVLNKTNANKIAELYGFDTEQWAGQRIDLFEADVEFGGKITKGLRVAAPSRAAQSAPTQPQYAPQPQQYAQPPQQYAPSAPAPAYTPPSHIIPGPTPHQPAPQQAPAPAPRTSIEDDEIPF